MVRNMFWKVILIDMRVTDVAKYALYLSLPGNNPCLSNLTSNAVEMLGYQITTLKTQMNIKYGKTSQNSSWFWFE